MFCVNSSSLLSTLVENQEQFQLIFKHSLKRETLSIPLKSRYDIFSFDYINQSLPFTLKRLFHINVGNEYVLGGPFASFNFEVLLNYHSPQPKMRSQKEDEEDRVEFCEMLRF